MCDDIGILYRVSARQRSYALSGHPVSRIREIRCRYKDKNYLYFKAVFLKLSAEYIQKGRRQSWRLPFLPVCEQPIALRLRSEIGIGVHF